jgi:hypothetical protein
MIAHMRIRIAAAAVFLILAACANRAADPLREHLAGKQAAVFVFLATDCPLSQRYTKTLSDLRGEFHDDAIEFRAVFAGAAKPAVDEFVRAYGVTLPVVLDDDYRLADYFGAAKTPEVFVVDAEGRTVYKGAIDNWSPELGTYRTVITERYLRDALTNVIQHREVRVKQTEAVGCFIERLSPLGQGRAPGAGFND